MSLKTSPKHDQTDLFRMELINQINLQHPLVQLTQIIDWSACETQFSPLYASDVGRAGYPIRLMVGLECLRQMHDLSDEAVVNSWVENPYWQYFCGEQYFCHHLPIDPSLMTIFRQRIGESGCEFILGLTVKAGLATGTVSARALTEVNVDTTVQEKAITFPTDAKLLNKARINLVKQAKRAGINLRQSYERVGKSTFAQSARYAHAKQFKRARAATKKLKTMLGRVIRDIARKANEAQSRALAEVLEIAQRIHDQKKQRGEQPKVYSVHAPEVECIAKGKAHKPYEFGVKVSIVSTNSDNFIIGAQALHGSPYDGHTLEAALAQAGRISQVPIKHAHVDRGYRGHGIPEYETRVWITGMKRGVTVTRKKKLRRRNAIEPIIGHLKNDGRLGRNFLKGKQGDKVNAILCAIGHNLRKILKKLRLFLRLFLENALIHLFWALAKQLTNIRFVLS